MVSGGDVFETLDIPGQDFHVVKNENEEIVKTILICIFLKEPKKLLKNLTTNMQKALEINVYFA